MSVGQVKSMYNKMARKTTPNSGILRDLETGIEYEFSRPSFTVKPFTWNVKKYDYVTFTISDGIAVDVTLYKIHNSGLVVTKL